MWSLSFGFLDKLGNRMLHFRRGNPFTRFDCDKISAMNSHADGRVGLVQPQRFSELTQLLNVETAARPLLVRVSPVSIILEARTLTDCLHTEVSYKVVFRMTRIRLLGRVILFNAAADRIALTNCGVRVGNNLKQSIS